MLSDEEKSDVITNIDKYSYDEIEAKLSVICKRNKVNFSLNNNEEQEFTYNFHEEETNGFDIPDWVKAVQEVEKSLNN